MAGRRVIGLDWIVAQGWAPRTDRSGSRPLPDSPDETGAEAAEEAGRKELIEQVVGKALESLTENEREFVERFYYMGMGYAEIAEKSGRAIHKLEAMHRRALRKLRRELASFVADRYRLEQGEELPSNCPLCNSPYRPQIDLLIEHKENFQTWKEVIREIREKYGIRVGAPQVLIGHKKYH